MTLDKSFHRLAFVSETIVYICSKPSNVHMYRYYVWKYQTAVAMLDQTDWLSRLLDRQQDRRHELPAPVQRQSQICCFGNNAKMMPARLSFFVRAAERVHCQPAISFASTSRLPFRLLEAGVQSSV